MGLDEGERGREKRREERSIAGPRVFTQEKPRRDNRMRPIGNAGEDLPVAAVQGLCI